MSSTSAVVVALKIVWEASTRMPTLDSDLLWFFERKDIHITAPVQFGLCQLLYFIEL